MFFLNRYWLLDAVFRYFVDNGRSPMMCRTAFISSTIFTFIGFMFSELIMFYRVYAISGRVRALGIWLIIQFGVFHVGSFIAVVAFIKSAEYQISPLPSIMPCMPVEQLSARGKEIALYALLLLSHTLILLLTLLVMIKKHRKTKSTLASVFYRDGFVYFLGLAVTSAVNIVISGTAPYNCDAMFLVPQRIIHGILASRAILHLREQSQKELPIERGRELTEIYFADEQGRTIPRLFQRRRGMIVSVALAGVLPID
ncbi:hypothetical protein FA15DRAFT_704673 [Coprinopsis marcescibilis]|uniref:Uncharacterized protein n=1 Tax=Coprinopsis marcescibilis TaxID=230819 RepID=A0A5C3KV69_COPMA|nr:hypothetical protein FA15DRAFT_704673 [Coprinopsis marcescibilis]